VFSDELDFNTNGAQDYFGRVALYEDRNQYLSSEEETSVNTQRAVRPSQTVNYGKTNFSPS
jgi:hypothetical protein